MIPPDGRPARNCANENVRQARILVVDGRSDFRSQICTLLRGAGYGPEVFARAADILGAPLPGAPCCIVASAVLPDMDGPGLIGSLGHRGEPIPVILVADTADVSLSVRSMKAGAVDYLTRPFDGRDLLAAVETALDLDTERRSAARMRREVTQRFETLTRREQQVMDGVVRGLMNKQIAWELQISEITVKLHRSSLMRKMALRSVPDLVRASMSLAA